MSYYSYAHDPYQGSPNQSYSYQPEPAFSPAAPSQPSIGMVPGLYGAATQGSFDQNRNVIPGLAFGTQSTTASWQQQQPQHQPTLVPAAQYYPSNPPSQTPQNQASGPANATMARSQDGTAEEGEISEGGYDDFYEPAEPKGMDVETQEEEDVYDPADSTWYDAGPRHAEQHHHGAFSSCYAVLRIPERFVANIQRT